MLSCWTKMAKDNGFDGLTYVYQSAAASLDTSWDRSGFDYGVEMNPGYVNGLSKSSSKRRLNKLFKYSREIKRILNIQVSLLPGRKFNNHVKRFDYDECR